MRPLTAVPNHRNNVLPAILSTRQVSFFAFMLLLQRQQLVLYSIYSIYLFKLEVCIIFLIMPYTLTYTSHYLERKYLQTTAISQLIDDQ